MTSLPEKLAEISRSAGVKSAYGDPVQIDGVSMVPVALVYYGFGGGEGESEDKGSGTGGGGGGASLPIGAYVRSGGTLRFEPNVISLLAVGIPFVWVAGKALARVIRALKK
ncbi:hypothetical protein E3T26_14200 [Cryobacterium sp. TMT1-21]|uniref:Sporulation protein n=1 Tax=Cryobacterium shii TaxID=1259235 RepID=A0AAQ2C9L0_9MICO|nr:MULTISPECIES: hypothetical protein [Cryobacterium]TFC53138.1 hypothetical protein E3O49_00295 [Cryobacterium shii]TFC87691.1 hypothetical protein E3T24_04325 [Cryobacterium sp. TmT2-59]TFD10101.1 hypothetical protein E3T26_14200 [Cryobacterium sp. TMT1-21]TFD20701.1 hypothetical protein E3T32_08315 [Cryobacterium sp. TMT2-23]TFD22044.1 hypothetical protein E3T42_00230 [Cryobacterium sp. TMT4-10]